MERNNSLPTGGKSLRFHRCQLTLNTGVALARYTSQGKVLAFIGAAIRLREGSKDKVFIVQPHHLIDRHMISPEGETVVLEGEAQRRRYNVDFLGCDEVTQRFEGMSPGGGYGIVYTQRMGLRPEFSYQERPIVSASWALVEKANMRGRGDMPVFPVAEASEEADATENTLSAIDVALGTSTAWYLAAQCLAVTGGNPKMPAGGPVIPAELNAAVNAELGFRAAKAPQRGGRSSAPSQAQMTAFISSLRPEEREALLKMQVTP